MLERAERPVRRAHAPAEFAYVPMALWMGRRAGIPRERILNFRSVDELTMAFE